MYLNILGRTKVLRLLVVSCGCAFVTTSCVFLYVGGPERDKGPLTPKREYVAETIVGTWRWVPDEQYVGSPDFYYTFHSDGAVYGSSEAVEDSTADEATYEVKLEPSLCHPGDLAYQIRVDGDFRFAYEFTEITKDTLRMADCSSGEDDPPQLTFVRVTSGPEEDPPEE